MCLILFLIIKTLLITWLNSIVTYLCYDFEASNKKRIQCMVCIPFSHMFTAALILFTNITFIQALCSDVHSLGLGVTEASFYFSLWWFVIIDHVLVAYDLNTSIPALFRLLLICCITCIYLLLHFIPVTDHFE